MSQVDEEVSEAVPNAMAPLTDLVAWDSTEGPASSAPVAKTGKKKAAAASKTRLRLAD
jgi:hypothetical protein